MVAVVVLQVVFYEVVVDYNFEYPSKCDFAVFVCLEKLDVKSLMPYSIVSLRVVSYIYPILKVQNHSYGILFTHK